MSGRPPPHGGGDCKGEGITRGRVSTAHAQHAHDRKKLGFLLQLVIFLPIQTILHPHNVAQPDVSPHPQHKRCQCTQPQQRHMQKKARIKSVLNSKCECRTPLRFTYVQDMHHSTWRLHPQPPFGYVQPHGDTSCFAMGFLCCQQMRRTNQNYLHLHALTVEPLDMYWANRKKETTNL